MAEWLSKALENKPGTLLTTSQKQFIAKPYEVKVSMEEDDGEERNLHPAWQEAVFFIRESRYEENEKGGHRKAPLACVLV